LTGAISAHTQFPLDDIRCHYFLDDQKVIDLLNRLESLREILTGDGRTLAQAALAWIWTRSNLTIPIPGFKTAVQVMENVRSTEFKLLTSEQMRQIVELYSRNIIIQ